VRGRSGGLFNPPLFIFVKDLAPFELYNLEEETLNYVLSLPDEEKTGYFHNLITRFYSEQELSSEKYKELQLAYRASFMLEKIYRNNRYLKDGFRPVYSKTGLIRDLTNSLYFIPQHLHVH